MKCPNCGLEQPENAETCGGCGLIFAKWRERHPPPEAAATPEGDPPGNAAPGQADGAAAEPEHHGLPANKVVFIFVPLIIALAALLFWPSKPAKRAVAAIPLPTSLYGSATVWPTAPPEPTTPTPLSTPMTIAGQAWQYHGKVRDCLRLTFLGGASIVFSNHGVAVTAITDSQGFYHITVPPLARGEAYEVRLSHPSCREGYWTDDPSNLPIEARLGRAYDYQENRQFRGAEGGGGDTAQDFSMFPWQLSEQEQMWLHNVRPPEQP